MTSEFYKTKLNHLNLMTKLEDGWYNFDYGKTPGKKISNISIENVKTFLHNIHDIENMIISPLSTGGILMSISIDDWEYYIDFMIDGKISVEGFDTNTYAAAKEVIFDDLTKKFYTHINNLLFDEEIKK